MIIDEVSMLDCKVMEGLHKQLTITKSKPEVGFGRMNMVFISDFLHLPAVINPNLYPMFAISITGYKTPYSYSYHSS